MNSPCESILKLFVASALVLCPCLGNSRLVAQESNDVLDWIDANAAMVGVVRDPDAIFDYAEKNEIWPNKYWGHAVDLLLDKKHGVLSQEDVIEARQWIESVVENLRQVHEIAIVIHEFSLEQTTFSIMIRAPADVRREIRDHLEKFSDLGVAGSFETSGELARFHHDSFGDWEFVSNDRESLLAIMDKRNEAVGSFRSISESRRFRTVESNFRESQGGVCIFQAFGIPSRIRPLFPRISDIRWEGLLIDELPSFGFQLFVIPDHTNEGSFPEPVFVFDANVTFTRPRQGLGKLVQSYTPLEHMPDLLGDEFDVSAISFDPVRKFAIAEEIYDSYDEKIRKGRSFEELMTSDWVPDDRRSFTEDYIPRVKSKIKIRFRNQQGEPATIQLESVNDADAAERWLQGLLEIEELSDVPTASSYQEQKHTPGWLIARETNEGANFPLDGNAHFLSDDWHIYGFRDEVLRRAKASEKKVPMKEQRIGKLVAAVAQNLGLQAQPFRIEFASRQKYTKFAESLELQRIVRKHGKNFRDMLAEPLGEFGYRLEVESRDDTIAVVPVLFWKGLLQHVGDHVTLFANDGDSLRVSGGLFEAEQE